MGVPRSLATLLSLVLITLSFILLMLAALPTLVQQFTTLATVIIPQGIQAIVEQWQSGEIIRQYPFLEFIQTINVDMPTLINTFSGQLAQAAGQFGVSVLPVLGGVADTVLSILIMVFLSIYLLANPEMHQEGMIRLFPLWYRHRAREIFARLDQTLRGWLRATVISMALVGDRDLGRAGAARHPAGGGARRAGGAAVVHPQLRHDCRADPVDCGRHRAGAE